MASRLSAPDTPRPSQHARQAVGRRDDAQTGSRQQQRGIAAGTVILCLLIWVWRRPQQLLHPYVWDEEADWIQLFVQHGWTGAFKPINGYLELPANALVVLSAQLSFAHLPQLMYAFATLFFLVTICLIVYPSSHFGGVRVRCAFALAAVLVPANPETFGVLLYSFWWATLWPLIIIGWKRPRFGARVPLLAIAALSSPAGGALFIVFAVSYLRRRRQHDLVSALVLAAGFVTQLALTAGSPRGAVIQKSAGFVAVADQILRIGGFYLLRWDEQPTAGYGFLTFAGFMFLLALLGGVIYASMRTTDTASLLYVGTLIFVVLSATPAPLVSDPLFVGRYFFLPFIGLSWVLIYLVAPSTWRGHPRVERVAVKRMQGVAVGLLVLALFGLPAAFARAPATTAAKLSWSHELQICAGSTSRAFDVPVYVDGSLGSYWSVVMSPEQCRRLA